MAPITVSKCTSYALTYIIVQWPPRIVELGAKRIVVGGGSGHTYVSLMVYRGSTRCWGTIIIHKKLLTCLDICVEWNLSPASKSRHSEPIFGANAALETSHPRLHSGQYGWHGDR
jgi:hypothetical protein